MDLHCLDDYVGTKWLLIDVKGRLPTLRLDSSVDGAQEVTVSNPTLVTFSLVFLAYDDLLHFICIIHDGVDHC